MWGLDRGEEVRELMLLSGVEVTQRRQGRDVRHEACVKPFSAGGEDKHSGAAVGGVGLACHETILLKFRADQRGVRGIAVEGPGEVAHCRGRRAGVEGPQSGADGLGEPEPAEGIGE